MWVVGAVWKVGGMFVCVLGGGGGRRVRGRSAGVAALANRGTPSNPALCLLPSPLDCGPSAPSDVFLLFLLAYC